ncbi:hydroxymethylglutaryl-CoA reductase, degradative [Vagococcus elongatus]|uniref:3-hydroxy-3-methylglutaryl coenzyme A reductase n=2 Tax=Vagococcus elongatus TaxID=180344 RepID=A0A430B638_9ENTE|nr:hydroxymethylglutaryl-CoA reductase, degradative [Vagococcus elongatus]
MNETSNLSKFYKKNREERLSLLRDKRFLTQEAMAYFLENNLLTDEIADHLIENQVGQFPLPLGVALNFIVNGKDVVVPMVVEEPSVVAACSNAARYVRKTGGFKAVSGERLQTGQLIFYDLTDVDYAKNYLEENKAEIIALADQIHPSIVRRGGGTQEVVIEIIKDKQGVSQYLTVYLHIDVQEAMGANIVNTILEGLQPILADWLKAKPLLSILSNYNDQTLTTATCEIQVSDLATTTLSGSLVAEKIIRASDYASLDTYRAVTHNKGIMNGIDSVVIATGNDFRAVEAAAHAFASRTGRYRAMSQWQLSNDGKYLQGSLTLPMLIGSLGGAVSVLPIAKLSQELMKTSSSKEMANIIVSVGLAQNFAALRALVTEGIQKGHMSLHANALAIHAGAAGEEINQVAEQLRQKDNMTLETAHQLLEALRDAKKPNELPQ